MCQGTPRAGGTIIGRLRRRLESALAEAGTFKASRPRSFCGWLVGRVVRDMIYPRPKAKRAFSRVLGFLGGDRPRTRTIAGQRISVVPSRSIVEFRMALCGVYEPVLVRYLSETLKPGMTVADVGAHVGFFTLLAADHVGPSGKVVSFEPQPRNYERLKHNVALNGYDHVVTVPKALSTTPGAMTLHVAHEDTAFTTLAARADAVTIEVEVDTFDAALRRLGIESCDLIKIDIEGAELLAVRGMSETISRSPGLRLVVEVHTSEIEQLGGSAPELAELLRSHGFALWKLDDSGGALRPVSEHPTADELGGYLVCLPQTDAGH